MRNSSHLFAKRGKAIFQRQNLGAKALLLHHLNGAAQALVILVTQRDETERIGCGSIG